jgi:predicted ABC-type ATPase
MKPVSQMSEREAACFTNLKKAMNDSFIVVDYLENAARLAPNSDVEEDITAALVMMGMVQEMIESVVRDLTN